MAKKNLKNVVETIEEIVTETATYEDVEDIPANELSDQEEPEQQTVVHRTTHDYIQKGQPGVTLCSGRG